MVTLNLHLPADLNSTDATSPWLVGKISHRSRNVVSAFVVGTSTGAEPVAGGDIIGKLDIGGVHSASVAAAANGDARPDWLDLRLNADGDVVACGIAVGGVAALNVVRFDSSDVEGSSLLSTRERPEAETDEFEELARALRRRGRRRFWSGTGGGDCRNGLGFPGRFAAAMSLLSASSSCQTVADKVDRFQFCLRYLSRPSALDLAFWNAFFLVSLDFVLGAVVVSCFSSTSIAEDIMVYFQTVADVVISNLEELLAWIMGVPAGLKLNVELNSALGNFFMYHIYLWKTYMIMIQPVASIVLGCALFLGQFGLTIQICILRDLVALAAFHVYCFYVYAARLFNIQTSALWSLWRLFRGKKWNPLRQRVDSAAYDVDQLFVGTLVFTILLFLLPTILVYYAVFTGLRLLFLTFDGLLSRVVRTLNWFPVYTLILWLIDSPAVRSGFHLSMDDAGTPGRGEQVLLSGVPVRNFRLKTIRGSILHTLRASSVCESSGKDVLNFRDVLSSLATGKILYPL